MQPKSSLSEDEHREKLGIIQGRHRARYLSMMPVPMPKRYDQLIDIAAERQPRMILEVGTWNGARALEMLAVCPDAHYIGFDLFECATAETNKREKNVKRTYSLERAEAFLADYSVTLIRGDTRETLPAFVADHSAPDVDLAFIDGGHSIEAIASDWDAVSRIMASDGVVVFDDYYLGPEIDIERFGCNQTVAALPHEVLPVADCVVPDGLVKMVVVRMSDLP